MLFYSLLFTILNLSIVLASDINHSQCGKSQKKIDMLGIFPNLNEKPGDWPWMAVLGYKKSSNGETSYMCGASLISNQWLITAAHCVQNTASYSISIARFGGLGNDEDKNMIVDVPISEAIQHPNYTSVPILNDIALIRLKNPVNFTNYIQPICILSEPVHKTNEFYSNKKLYDVSWLRPKMGPRTIFQSLRKILIPLVDEGKCKQTYLNQRNALIDERVLCGDEMNDSRESCLQSSSGGSLSMMLNETFYLAGVLSYGSCSLIQYPAVYTRVAYYAEWIKSIANL